MRGLYSIAEKNPPLGHLGARNMVWVRPNAPDPQLEKFLKGHPFIFLGKVKVNGQWHFLLSQLTHKPPTRDDIYFNKVMKEQGFFNIFFQQGKSHLCAVPIMIKADEAADFISEQEIEVQNLSRPGQIVQKFNNCYLHEDQIYAVNLKDKTVHIPKDGITWIEQNNGQALAELLNTHSKVKNKDIHFIFNSKRNIMENYKKSELPSFVENKDSFKSSIKSSINSSIKSPIKPPQGPVNE